MPELPEVESAKKELIPYIKNKKIKEVIIREKKLREPISDELYNIKNCNINEILRRGKYIILKLSNKQQIIIHLGMSGSITIQSNDNPIKKHSHVDIVLEDDLIIRFNDPRKFGMFLLSDNYLENKYIKKCGVEPLEIENLGNYLYQKSRNKKIPIKTFLMKNEIVVGIGNIYANESLFKTSINPEILSMNLDLKTYQILANNIISILNNSINNGGTTLKDHQVGLNKQGNFQNNLFIYNQIKCKVCESDIEKITQNGRSTFFCPVCQKK